MNTLRRWLVAASTALLALVFAQPACMTSALWRDTSYQYSEEVAKPPELRACRDLDDAAAMVLQLSAPTAAIVHKHMPEIPADTQWLQIRPNERAIEVAQLLALAAHDPTCGDVQVWLLTQPEQDPVSVALYARNPAGAHLDKLRVRCTATPLPAPPTNLGAPIQTLTLAQVHMHEDGRLLIVRIAATPFALLVDTLGVLVVILIIPFTLPRLL